MAAIADEEGAEPSGEGSCRRKRSKDGKTKENW
jgi:hypothetical protein